MGRLRGAAYGGRLSDLPVCRGAPMSPIAAYYIFTASDHERAATAAHGIPLRRRPSLVERVRSVAAALRPQASDARAARTA